jgi:hypothetical protein
MLAHAKKLPRIAEDNGDSWALLSNESDGASKAWLNDPMTANKIGHSMLIFSAIACALVFRGIPVLLWAAIYLLSALAASTVWRKKPNLSPLTWFLGVVLFGGLTALIYTIGVHAFGSSSRPWMIFRLRGIVVPALALTSFSGFARALYIRYRKASNCGKELRM